MTLETCVEDVAERDWQVVDETEVLRVAVVGLGGFSHDALDALAASELCAPTAVVSSSAEKAARFADDFDVDSALTYDQFTAGDASDAYDAVYVVTPNARHLEYVEAAAAQGKHVLCEKPLEVSVERGERAVRACEDAGVTLMTGYRLQTDPAIRRVRDIVAAGAVGEPVQVHAGLSVHILEMGGPDQWRLDPELAGGGALVDAGVYPLNTTRFVLGADPVAVQATTAAPDPAFEGLDEHVAFQLAFDGGKTASCTTSFAAHYDDHLRVVGEDGSIHVEPAYGNTVDREVRVDRPAGDFSFTTEGVDELVEEFDYFANSALSGIAPEPDGRDGLTDLRVVEAVYESAETGERVAVETDD